MGSIYAKHFGREEIAEAIYEQYLPVPGEEKLPETSEGIVLALADKLDHLCALFGVGEKPSGEKDPYGLRRSAYGIIKILIGKRLFLNLEEAVNFGLDLVFDQVDFGLLRIRFGLFVCDSFFYRFRSVRVVLWRRPVCVSVPLGQVPSQ